MRDPRDDPRPGDCVTNGVQSLWVAGTQDRYVALIAGHKVTRDQGGAVRLEARIVGLDVEDWPSLCCAPAITRVPVEAIIA